MNRIADSGISLLDFTCKIENFLREETAFQISWFVNYFYSSIGMWCAIRQFLRHLLVHLYPMKDLNWDQETSKSFCLHLSADKGWKVTVPRSLKLWWYFLQRLFKIFSSKHTNEHDRRPPLHHECFEVWDFKILETVACRNMSRNLVIQSLQGIPWHQDAL